MTQIPLCNYTDYYEATVYKKWNGPDAVDLAFELKDKGSMIGDPALVTVDAQRGKILFDATDEELLGLHYQVFISCHVYTNARVQETFYKFFKPFDVSIVGEIKEVVVPNNAPRLEEFRDSITL